MEEVLSTPSYREGRNDEWGEEKAFLAAEPQQIQKDGRNEKTCIWQPSRQRPIWGRETDGCKTSTRNKALTQPQSVPHNRFLLTKGEIRTQGRKPQVLLQQLLDLHSRDSGTRGGRRPVRVAEQARHPPAGLPPPTLSPGLMLRKPPESARGTRGEERVATEAVTAPGWSPDGADGPGGIRAVPEQPVRSAYEASRS